MSSPTFVQIHEFSTGISSKGTPEQWVSTGFTGQYINATISPIPPVVEISIRNNEFKVAEGAYSDQPAVIGRVVGSGESAWSVVAIVTRGQDEKGRSASFYRYFLCQGEDGLPKILAWIEAYKKQESKMPVFNPFKQREVGKPNLSYFPVTSFDLEDEVKSWLSNQLVPVIITAEKYTPEILNQLATEKAKINGEPIAWAFNVEGLEAIGRFQIIQAASEQAYQLFQRLKNTSDKALPPVVSDEQALIAGIKAFMTNPSAVKSQHVEAIANALSDEKVNKDYWLRIFNTQGAAHALKGAYTQQFVNLLTLRAIIIPDTLPEYLTWLYNGNKQYKTYELAEKCQNQISILLKKNPELEQKFEGKLSQGFQILLDLAVNGQGIILSQDGLWDKFSHQFIQEVDHDLNLMEDFDKHKVEADKFKIQNENLLNKQELKDYWSPNLPYRSKQEYKFFAELFKKLKAYKISAFFYHVCQHKIPQKIFYEISDSGYETEIYGITVKRELSFIEKIIRVFETIILLIPNTIIAAINICKFLFETLGHQMKNLFKNKDRTSNYYRLSFNPKITIAVLLVILAIIILIVYVLKNIQPDLLTYNFCLFPPQKSSTSNNSSVIKPEKMKIALDKFPQTRQLLQQIIQDIKKETMINDEKIIKSALKDSLGKSDLDYAAAIEQKECDRTKAKQAWVEAIYNYQKKRSPKHAVGYMNPPQGKNDTTYEFLKTDIKSYLSRDFT